MDTVAGGWFGRGVTRQTPAGYYEDASGAYIVGRFRSTGMGAFHGVLLVTPGGCVRLDDVAGAAHLGRDDGFEVFAVAVAPAAVWLDLYRSNRGRESAAVYRGGLVVAQDLSFEEARAAGLAAASPAVATNG
jgi:hypothetical protein